MVFQPGQSGNPAGRPKSCFQDYKPRAAYFLETMSRREILEITNNPDNLDKYSAFDSMILQHIANSFTGKGDQFAATERERLMDRTTGKPKQAMIGGDEDDPAIRHEHSASPEDRELIARYLQQKAPK